MFRLNLLNDERLGIDGASVAEALDLLDHDSGEGGHLDVVLPVGLGPALDVGEGGPVHASLLGNT